MASGTLTLSTSYTLMGRIIYTSVANGVAENTSTVTATIQARKTSNTNVATSGTWKGTLKIGGTSKSFSVSTKVNSDAWVTLYSFSVTIAHNEAGDGTFALSGSVAGPAGTSLAGYTVSGSDTIALDRIARFATIKTAPDFNDEENPTITYSNPAGNSVDLLRACISLDGTNDDVAYRDISKTGTSYTFSLTDAERDVLRAATTGSNSRTVKFYVRSEIGSEYKGSNLSANFTIKNPKPTISPTIIDSNSTTVALTGNSSKLVKFYSNAKITMGAVAVKKATLTSKKVTCGSKSLTADGTINAVESGTFTFTATDNRGNTTTKDVTTSFVEYVKLSCNLDNSMPTGEGNMTVKVNGNYFNGSFGAVSNTLSVYYRYKVDGGAYSNWAAMTVTKSGNTYAATASLTGLDYQAAYVFQAYAVDKLATVYSVERKVKAKPVFDWSGSDFKFNVPVYDRFGTVFGNGLAAYTGGGDSGIDPNTTLEELCLTSHTNAPQGLGTFYYIHTAFYNTKSATAARAQIAFPYNKAGSMYHRYYASGAWSGWSRYMNADETYPVGSYYISANATSPASLFGGTWHRIESRFLWAAPASSTLGATAGEMTHTLTIDEMPSHSHGLKRITSALASSSSGWARFASDGTADNSVITNTGGGAAHNNMPPYVNVAIWRRTA